MSEPLIKRIFDFKYGRASSSDHVVEAFEQDIEELVALLIQSFPVAVSTGNLGWWDIFRPFSAELQGLIHEKNVRNLPVTRFPLTNTFYRQPVVSGRICHDGPLLKVTKHPFLKGNFLQTRFLPSNTKNSGWSLCLPGPFTFSRAAAINLDGQEVYKTKDQLMIDFSRILEEELNYLSSEGFSHVVLDESFFAWEIIEYDSASLLSDLWKEIATKSSLRIGLHTNHYLDEEKLQLLLNSKVWGIGYDCIKNDIHKLLEHDFNGKALLAGVVDGQSYLRDANKDVVVEEIDELVNLGRDLAETQAKEIILAPTSRLEFVPRSVANHKIKTLGKALEKLQ
ncbi:MAG: hypothetical protein ACXACK_10295 [Candidatus Hodarchaeales archaeon]